MRTIHYITNNPFMAEASLEGIQEDTLYFMESSDYIFGGIICPIHRWVNKETTIPIVRGAILGNTFLFDNGKSLWIVMSTKEQTSEVTLQEIIIETLANLGLKDVSISSNDIIYNDKQLGMTAPPMQYTNFLTAGQLSFSIDIEKHKANLVSPTTKWADKQCDTLDEWLSGINDVSDITIDTFIEECKKVVASKLNIEVTDGKFSQDEIDIITKLKTDKYSNSDYINYGRIIQKPDFE